MFINYLNNMKYFCCLLSVAFLPLVLTSSGFTAELSGCGTSIQNDYESDYDDNNFTSYNVSFETNEDGLKTIKLDTGANAINPDSIIIPFEQEVSVTFVFEGAGYKLNDFGWMYYDNGIGGEKFQVYENVNDNNNNGVLDVSTSSTTNKYGDRNGDGVVNALDNKETLGTFAAGTELVFYLKSDDAHATFFTKTAWNPDVYTSTNNQCSGTTFTKTFHLGNPGGEGTCLLDSGWMDPAAIARLATIFGVAISTSDTYQMTINRNQKFPHVIVGAPANDPDQWILGWEDLVGGGDTDENDLVFKINRQSGGSVILKSEAQGNLNPLKPSDPLAYFTSVIIEVYDYMPCDGDTEIKYYVSINGGVNWIEVAEWDTIKTLTVNGSDISIGDPVVNWSYGKPAYTYRSARLDFSTLGYSGNELLWKSVLISNDEQCVPEIFDVKLDGTVALHSNFSRAAPVAKVNVLYSGNYETPAVDWIDKSTLRGHLLAEMIYDSTDPSGGTIICTTTPPVPAYCPYIWDAGEALNSKTANENESDAALRRNIYFPDIKTAQVTGEEIAKGDGTTLVFTGTLAHFPIAYGTLEITDTEENFRDKRIKTLEGDKSGKGTINRYTGEFTIEFAKAPIVDIPIIASYTYYETYDLQEFTTNNVDNLMLGLDDTYINGTDPGYKYDFNNDDAFSEADGDTLVKWTRGYNKDGSTEKEWKLGAIDHSVPALLTPPPMTPFWYFSDEITDEEKEHYDIFTEANNYKEATEAVGETEAEEGHEARPTVIFVGSRSGMLHAFDAGTFRWGDNPDTTSIKEYRGYFADDNYGTGKELWSFIPTNLVSRLKNNFMNSEDQAYVDASPAIADIYTGTEWKSVVLSAQGNGGDTVFCLDVTDPTAPKFMWEFSDPDLYRSISSPSVAAVGRVLSEDGLSIWAAFFVSGKTYDTTLDPSIYMVDIATGSLIERIFLDAAGDAGKGGTPSGQPALIDSDDNGFIDRAYIGTDKGYLYKINIPDTKDATDPKITHCVINDSTETNYFKPIYGSPALMNKTTLSLDSDGTTVIHNYDIRIFFGTGDSPYLDENINNADTEYYFLAYSDRDDKDECNMILTPDWALALPAGERVWASAFASAGQVYFGTSTSETEDPCEGYSETSDNGKGKIYAFNADDGKESFSEQVGDIISSPIVVDEHLYFKTTNISKVKSYGKDEYNNENTTKTITGKPASVKSWKEINEINGMPLQCP